MDFTIAQDDPRTTTPAEFDIVPAGTHLMEIKSAEEKANPYKQCDENPTGDCLSLRLSAVNGRFKFLFDDIPQHLGWRAKQLAAACGNDVAGGVLSLNPNDLIGRVITVEVSHYTSKAGKVSAVVKKYLPAQPAAASKPKVAAIRKPAAMVVENQSEDTIPF
jgi:hypothetical protein